MREAAGVESLPWSGVHCDGGCESAGGLRGDMGGDRGDLEGGK